MINTIVEISEITYETVPVTAELVDSIRTRGIAIPVRVNRTDEGYCCVDGRRRLSAAAILAAEDERFARIPVVLMNDYSKAGSAYWGRTRNRH